MRPTYGCVENFRDFLITPTATFLNQTVKMPRHCISSFLEWAKNSMLLFRSTLWMCIQNLKSVALPVPEIIGVPKNCGSPCLCLTPYSPLPKNPIGLGFHTFLSQHSFVRNFRLKFWAGVANTNLEEEEAVGGRGWYHSIRADDMRSQDPALHYSASRGKNGKRGNKYYKINLINLINYTKLP